MEADVNPIELVHPARLSDGLSTTGPGVVVRTRGSNQKRHPRRIAGSLFERSLVERQLTVLSCTCATDQTLSSIGQLKNISYRPRRVNARQFVLATKVAKDVRRIPFEPTKHDRSLILVIIDLHVLSPLSSPRWTAFSDFFQPSHCNLSGHSPSGSR